MPHRFVLFLGLICFLSQSSWAEDLNKSRDWPQWRGPQRDAISTETGLLKEWPKEGPPLLWNSKEVNGGKSIGTGWSSITIADGKIYTLGDHGKEGFLFCLDEATGKHLWATAISPNYSDGGPRCSPTVDGNRVYALTPHGILVCLDAAKGDIVWKKSLQKDFHGKMMSSWSYSESPLIDGEKLVCTPGGEEAALVALDKDKGELIWKAPITQPGQAGAGYSSIVITEVGGIRQYITLLGKGGGLVGVDAKTGKFLWNYNKAANTVANIPTAIVKGDLVFTSTAYGAGAALLQLIPEGDGIKVKEVYFLNSTKLQNHHGGMILLGDYIYGGHGQNAGNPFCLEMKTGKLTWGPERGVGRGSAAFLFADGNLYVRYEGGDMALIEATPKKYNLISHFSLPGSMGTGWPHPVILHGRLYIRGRDQLLCFDIKQK